MKTKPVAYPFVQVMGQKICFSDGSDKKLRDRTGTWRVLQKAKAMTTFPHSLRTAWAAPNSKALSEQALQAGAKGSAARSHYFGGTFSNQSQLPRRRYFHSSKNKSPPIPALASCLPLVSLCMLIGWTCTALHKFQPLWTPLFYSRPNPHGKQAQTFCRTDKRRSNSGQNHLSVQVNCKLNVPYLRGRKDEVCSTSPSPSDAGIS